MTGMEWLNYHHLLYFWTVVREGSISQACKQLRLAQPTISAQLHSLDDRFNEKLFQRSGRRLELAEIGRIVYGYGRPSGRPFRFTVGISDALPKVIAHRLLEPSLHLQQVSPPGLLLGIVISVVSLDFVASGRGGPQIKIDHQLSQSPSIYQDDLGVDTYDVSLGVL
jgi:hypothetical protein